MTALRLTPWTPTTTAGSRRRNNGTGLGDSHLGRAICLGSGNTANVLGFGLHDAEIGCTVGRAARGFGTARCFPLLPQRLRPIQSADSGQLRFRGSPSTWSAGRTDEPSGLGVPPYLGVHQRYVAGWLSLTGKDYHYFTIDDLRAASGVTGPQKRIRNRTKHGLSEVVSLLGQADRILVILGAFVDYPYVSAEPPRIDEVIRLLRPYQAPKTLFYTLGGSSAHIDPTEMTEFRSVVTGLAYNFLSAGSLHSHEPNYSLLRRVSVLSAELLDQIPYPVVVELETGSGCRRRPGCSFCIESIRGMSPQYRDPADIIAEAEALGAHGAEFFRLGRQPSFYSYMGACERSVRTLLEGIRTACPTLRVLHIDNVDPAEVVTGNGRLLTRHVVKYCTSGNIAPFGVESFDPEVRKQSNLNGTLSQIHEAVRVINEEGARRGSSGLPRFLPGINLIHGLLGQSDGTLAMNLENLTRIMDCGYLVRRTFVRELTCPSGVTLTLAQPKPASDSFIEWERQIHETFTGPMLRRVVPVGTKLPDCRVEIHLRGGSLLRQMATCPVRVLVENRILPLDSFYDVVVDGYEDSRTVRGRVI